MASAECFKMTNGIQLIFRVFTCEKDRWAGILFFQKRWDSGGRWCYCYMMVKAAALSFVLPWIPRNKIEYCLSETIDCCTINQFHSKIVGIHFLSSFFFNLFSFFIISCSLLLCCTAAKQRAQQSAAETFAQSLTQRAQRRRLANCLLFI